MAIDIHITQQDIESIATRLDAFATALTERERAILLGTFALASQEIAAERRAGDAGEEKAAVPARPPAPTVPPRFTSIGDFTSAERAFAEQAWNLAVRQVFYARWFVRHMASVSRSARIALWNGTAAFPGNTGNGRPRVWFGDYTNARFDNVRDVLDTLWGKFVDSPWKMKRQHCLIWATAHVIVYPQVRLCDNFFGNRADASRVLVHELSHHIWINAPLRQVKDIHTAPIPPCTGPNNACYGASDALMLARSHPKHAVATPDNYALFCRSYYDAL